MSEGPQGPGWWFAADGRWYPPYLRPAAAPLPPPRKPWVVRYWPALAGSVALLVAVVLVSFYDLSPGPARPAQPTTSPTVSRGGPAGSTPGSSRGSRLLLGPVTASTELTADRGTVIYSDDFGDPQSGWSTAPLPSGTTFEYGPGGYVVVARASCTISPTRPTRTRCSS